MKWTNLLIPPVAPGQKVTEEDWDNIFKKKEDSSNGSRSEQQRIQRDTDSK